MKEPEQYVSCLMKDALLALREQLRWRKYPEEKPEEGMQCDVWKDSEYGETIFYFDSSFRWEDVKFWRPRGEVPKEEK